LKRGANPLSQESDKSRIPSYFVLSLLLGIPFLCAWLGFTATMAKDGRSPVTDWLDPLLAGLTLLSILFVQLVWVILWPRLQHVPFKKGLALLLVISQWAYIFGEIVSNTITIGEPPQDIGSLFEIAAGAIAFLCSAAFALLYLVKQSNDGNGRRTLLLPVIALILFVGVLWWFTHPIDQSQPGAPENIPGNPVYNFFH
jgi:hypothetical protein